MLTRKSVNYEAHNNAPAYQSSTQLRYSDSKIENLAMFGEYISLHCLQLLYSI